MFVITRLRFIVCLLKAGKLSEIESENLALTTVMHRIYFPFPFYCILTYHFFFLF